MIAQIGPPVTWFVFAGVAGGFLNALVSDNLFLWPVRITASPQMRILRPGLVLNMLIGIGASMAARRAFGGLAPATTTVSVADLVLALVGGVCAGALAARWMTNEADKRLLRAAVSKACAAPAAHPDTAHVMEIAPPYDVFVTASDLVLHFRPSR